MRNYLVILFILLGFKTVPKKEIDNVFFVYNIEAYLFDSYLDKLSFSYMEKENNFLLELIKNEKIEKVEFDIDYSSLFGLNNFLLTGDSSSFEYDLELKNNKYLLNKIKFLKDKNCEVSFYTDTLIFNISNYANMLLNEYFIPYNNEELNQNINARSIIKFNDEFVRKNKISNKKHIKRTHELIKILVQLTRHRSSSIAKIKLFKKNYDNDFNAYLESIRINKLELNMKSGLNKIVNCLNFKSNTCLNNYFNYIESSINSTNNKKTLHIIDNNIYQSPFYNQNIKKMLRDRKDLFKVYRIYNTPIDEYFTDSFIARRDTTRQIKDSTVIGNEFIYTYR